MDDALYSGWGVRTMAPREGGYNPVEYHNGTVWPHDNSLIAAGLARYGHHDAAARIAADILRAAGFFDHRLPEVFAGCDERLTYAPVEYPDRVQPAGVGGGRAAAAAHHGPRPVARAGRDRLRPAPSRAAFGDVVLTGLRGRWGRADITANGAGQVIA